MSAPGRSQATNTLVPSPCVNICRMNEATGLCDGCLRTIDEIAAWASLDDRAKRAVWKQLHARRAALPVSPMSSGSAR
jgi:predicted Fe-S protein YdhL (DUF1289 family)